MAKPVEQLLTEASKREPSKTLAEALVKAQSMMNHAHLDGKNPHFKSKYSTLQSVIDAVKPSLNVCGIAFLQRAHSADGGVSVETIFIHESGEQLSAGCVFVPVDKFNAHGTGSAYTYAKRYALAMACGIGADEDDDGNTAVANAPVKRPQSVAETVLEEMGTPVTEKTMEYVAGLRAAVFGEDQAGAVQLWSECDNEEKTAIWKSLDSKERSTLKRWFE